jgi:hypothetical protein
VKFWTGLLLVAPILPLQAQSPGTLRDSAQGLFMDGKLQALMLTTESRWAAARLWRQSGDLFGRIGDTGSQAEMLLNVGMMFGALRERDSALTCFRQSAQLFGAARRPKDQARAWVRGSIVLRKDANLDSAVAWSERALATSRAIHDVWRSPRPQTHRRRH